jgi:hypothetical protein
MTEEKNPNKVLSNLPPVLLREKSLIEPIVKNPFKHVLPMRTFDKVKVVISI